MATDFDPEFCFVETKGKGDGKIVRVCWIRCFGDISSARLSVTILDGDDGE
jgi:hypothetical protein